MQVLKNVATRARIDPKKKVVHDSDVYVGLYGKDFELAKRAAAARLGTRKRLVNVIYYIQRMKNKNMLPFSLRLCPPPQKRDKPRITNRPTHTLKGAALSIRQTNRTHRH